MCKQAWAQRVPAVLSFEVRNGCQRASNARDFQPLLPWIMPVSVDNVMLVSIMAKHIVAFLIECQAHHIATSFDFLMAVDNMACFWLRTNSSIFGSCDLPSL